MMEELSLEMRKKNLFSAAEYLLQEEDWRKLRVFFAELKEEAEDLSADDKDYFLSFCYEMLFHRRGAVRRMAAQTMGILLAQLGDDLKNIWEPLLKKLLFPEIQLDATRQHWLSYCLLQIMATAVRNMEGRTKREFLRIYEMYFRSVRWGESSCMNLLSGLLQVDAEEWTPLQKHEIFGFARQFLNSGSEDIITMSLFVMKNWMEGGWQPQEDELRYLKNVTLPEGAAYPQIYLLNLLIGQKETDIPEELRESSDSLIQKNMQQDDDWATKLVRLDILKDRSQSGDKALYASHLQNVLRLNSHPMVFLHTGDELLAVMPDLEEQLNYAICLDILKEIEQGVDSANFIASFLGKAYFFLSEKHQKEFRDRFLDLFDSNDPTTVMTVMEVIAEICSGRTEEEPKLEGASLPGLLSKGVFSYRKEISEETKFLIRTYQLQDLVGQYGARELGGAEAESKRPVAFFSDLFDPFTVRDRAIVEEILGMDFDVCLAVNDFDWEKNPQPARVRRKMLQMTLADLKSVTILPEDVSVYLKNETDLEKLSALFPGREVWLVSENTKIEGTGQGAAHFSHIVFSDYEVQRHMDREAIRQVIRGNVVTLQLPVRYQGITADELQVRISEGRNINGFVDGQVQRMIYEKNLYFDKPSYKKRALTKRIDTFFEEEKVLVQGFEGEIPYQGTACFRKAGNTAVITDVYGDVTEQEDYRNLALMELLTWCQSKHYSHVVCFDAKKYAELLLPYGFLYMKEYEDGLTLDLSKVLVLFMDVESMINEQYAQDPKVQRQIRKNQRRLREAAARLYPGKLVLAFPTNVLNDKLIRLIQGVNQAQEQEAVCVPFGKMLKGVRIPDTITWEMNTEKLYYPDLSHFQIAQLPEYPSLKAQIESLKSLNRPILFIDDLYHKGYRLQKIMELTDQAGIEVKGLAVSTLSNRGALLAKERHLTIHPVYTVPDMAVWMLESDLYPFVGGDGIEGESAWEDFDALRSINTLLPYEFPPFLKDASVQAVYAFSEICMENARSLYLLLEETYREKQHHILTLERLQEVMAEPRYPVGSVQEGDRRKKISDLISVEIQKLHRMRIRTV